MLFHILKVSYTKKCLQRSIPLLDRISYERSTVLLAHLGNNVPLKPANKSAIYCNHIQSKRKEKKENPTVYVRFRYFRSGLLLSSQNYASQMIVLIYVLSKLTHCILVHIIKEVVSRIIVCPNHIHLAFQIPSNTFGSPLPSRRADFDYR